MPGAKSITWNEANDAKMLHALLHYSNIVLPAKLADQIAAYMGNTVPGRAIQSHVQITKKGMKNKLGAAGTSTLSITASPSTPAGPSGGKKRPASAAALVTPSKKKQKSVEETSEEEEEEGESSHGEDLGDESKVTVKAEKTTPPAAGPASANAKGKGKATARASRSRSSPRDKRPVNYSKLNDPFTTMEGATGSDGEGVFGTDDGNSSEDTSPSDKEFEEFEQEEYV
ncbi:hypothetical protein MMC30_001420 [Trapelia coarctata]|nr:hypothetical protein [Trapelia coarctata]